MCSHDPCPYLTAELAGIGGVIKARPSDFVVEEIPAYEPTGTGTHIYFRIEKEGVTTLAAIKIIAKALGRPPRDIGFAGLKDAQATTRQTLSLEHMDPARVASLNVGRIRVLWVNRHTNKIKLGHLRGNRFEIKIRPHDETVRSDAVCADRAAAILQVLSRRGVPNYFGPQRFGARGDNGEIGKAVLLGDYRTAVELILGRCGPYDRGPVAKARTLFDEGRFPESADAWPKGFRDQQKLCRIWIRSGGDAARCWRSLDRHLRSLYLNAFQSIMFNAVVARRIGELDRLWTGDLAYKHVNGACFRVTDAEAEQPRCANFEISPTGPIFGTRMTEPEGKAADMERQVLSESGVPPESIRPLDGVQMQGERRPLRIPLMDPSCTAGSDPDGPFVLIDFSLPAGCYATSVTREICKSDDSGDTVARVGPSS